MRICVFEDRRVDTLEPLTLTRPAFALRCGVFSLLERQAQAFGARESGAILRPVLADVCRLAQPGLVINDLTWLQNQPAVLVNARWLPAFEPTTDYTTPRVGVVDEEIAYVVAPSAPQIKEATPQACESWLEDCFGNLPHVPAGGSLFRFPWELVERNAELLSRDADRFKGRQEFAKRPGNLTVEGPLERVFVHHGAKIDPFVVADARNGPVIIDASAVVHSFTRLEGPCYVGPESWLLGAKLRGGTIGPKCRVGGEVEASIIHGCSNKYHDGFLGHSYVGEWVNLAAGTQTSDLRNDYGMVQMWINGERVSTGLTKVGTFFGDHTRTGLNTLLNTGSAVGAYCNLLPSASLLPQEMPSFCLFGNGHLQERRDLRQLCTTAATVVGRRHGEWTNAHSDFLFALYDETALHRRRVLQEHEQKRLRRSV